eukprot:TRINITY_DN612_c1_g6_i1.p1 TRINITY_DN612_c1_g6~~TRINITY_DN612_c1_g6_i1.p1  ORF type:complete len:250 (+),score=87.74 TRINITY_DN612_c1_g6_i1:60-809(+)
MADAVERGFSEHLHKREDGVLPEAVVECLAEAEAAGPIYKLTLVRTPIDAYVNVLMNMLSMGEYKHAMENSPYDTMFHLLLLINDRFVMQKNEVICLDENLKVLKDESEMRPLVVPEGLTYSGLLEGARQHMGDHAFSGYDPKDNNCQDFIVGVLEGNGLCTPEHKAFVKQDADAIFSQMPGVTSKLAVGLTDVAAVANNAVEGITNEVSERFESCKGDKEAGSSGDEHEGERKRDKLSRYAKAMFSRA